MLLKVLYHVGDTITLSTKMKKGTIHSDSLPVTISSDEGDIVLDKIISAEKTHIPAGGTALKIINDSQTIYLLVVRLYIDKGNGFAIVNKRSTLKLFKTLSAEVIE